MQSRDHRREVETALAEALAGDPQPVEIHGWTRLGHLELTRKRGLPSLAELMLVRPGARRDKTPLTTALAALRAVAHASAAPGVLELRVHPAVAAELDGRLARERDAAAAQAGRRLVVKAEPGRDAETFDIGVARSI